MISPTFDGVRKKMPYISVQDASNEENPQVFLDVSVNGGPPERMIIELFANVVPRTAENFRALCTGEKGKSENTGRPLHYKGTVFHTIFKGILAQGGDISGEERPGHWESLELGVSGESIYGGRFESENYKLRHSEGGMLAMAGYPNKIGSQFYITFSPQQLFYDGAHVVFGKIIEGMHTLYHIGEFGRPSGEPTGVIEVVDCGQISEGEKRKPLKREISYFKGVEEHTVKRKRMLSPETDSLQQSEDKKKNTMLSAQEKHEILELRQQAKGILARIEEIARGRGVHIPDDPPPRPQ